MKGSLRDAYTGASLMKAPDHTSSCVCVCLCAYLQAIYASVLPGELMRGYMNQFPIFPSWLGKNSSTNKHSRIVQELSSHMGLKSVFLLYRLKMMLLTHRWAQTAAATLNYFICLALFRTLSSKQAVNLDYLHYLRQAILNPLQKHGAEGAAEAVQLLDDYQLIKEDVDSIMEISVWGGQPDPYSKLDSKVRRWQHLKVFLLIMTATTEAPWWWWKC